MELINATGYDDKDTAFPSLPPPALLPHTDTQAPRHTHEQCNHVLEAPVCLQVSIGVGGDFRLRFAPSLPSLQNVSHLINTTNPSAGRRAEIFLLLFLKCLDKDLLSASLQLLLVLI